VELLQWGKLGLSLDRWFSNQLRLVKHLGFSIKENLVTSLTLSLRNGKHNPFALWIRNEMNYGSDLK
jgi:hypothetical protein